MKEIWKPIKGCENLKVSTFGNIKSKNEIRKAWIDSCGYPSISIIINRKNKKRIRIHRLVAKHFIENPNLYKTVNHIDGNKLNNNIKNLEWCSYRTNNLHARKTGLHKQIKGEQVKLARLNKEDVLKIRAEYQPRTNSLGKIAKKYGVGRSTIFQLIKRITWKHI